MGSGGAEHQLSILMKMLVERGYDLTYATFQDIPDHYHVNEKIKRVRLAKNKANWIKLLAIFKYMLMVKADVIIAFSQRLSVLSLIPMLFKPRIKVISSERNYSINGPDIYENILIKLKLYKRATYIVPNNYSQTAYLAKKMPCIENKLRTITNYTDTDSYAYLPYPKNPIIKVGLFCRVESQKNMHRFIEAIHILKERYHYEFHVDWYGQHKFTNKAQVEYYRIGIEKIRVYKLESIISFFDPISDVNIKLPSYDALCLPSLYEGFSNSLSEYICCGRPVLCSDVSDNHIMVHHGENGFLFDPLDVESIVDAFKRFMDLPIETRVDMGEKSRHIALNLFDKERFINSYVQLIEN